ncbi:HAD family hydrolase [Halorussus sp. MSC15.2]|uniref:HAD family hydrolase n=1 Tax=Halorussus sp. MSC15.2 TaxID=2283638 RepID=UPI0013D4F4EB|nr:HAD family hydrolase [Halorussus sp. MSC15.2]NEU56785.1 HAD family hydrolase [Halorussus sp. MSC15.2]
MPDYDAILFDNDGVLVEPPADATLRRAAESAFRAVGVQSPAEEHLADVLRGVTPESLRAVCGAYDLNPDEFWTARDRHASEAQRGEFREGTRARYDDVAALADLDHDFGIVSSNQHATIEFILDHCEFRDLFGTHYGREMGVESLDKKKPNPHYLDRALADLGADSALYVGDSESDVVAAHRAGLDSAFVRRDHCEGVELSVEPTYEVRDLWGITEIADGRSRR